MNDLYYRYSRNNKKNIIDKNYIYKCSLPYPLLNYIIPMSIISIITLIITIMLSVTLVPAFVLLFVSLILLMIFYSVPSQNYFIYEDILDSKTVDGTGRYILKFKRYPNVVAVDKYTYEDVKENERLCILVDMYRVPYLVIKKDNIPYSEDIKTLVVDNYEDIDKNVDEYLKENGIYDTEYYDAEGNSSSKLEVEGKTYFDLDTYQKLFINQYRTYGIGNILATILVIFMAVTTYYSLTSNGIIENKFYYQIAIAIIVALFSVNIYLNLKKYIGEKEKHRTRELYYKEEKVVEIAHYSELYTTSDRPIKVRTENNEDFFVASGNYVFDVKVGDIVYVFYNNGNYEFMINSRYYDISPEFIKK